MMKLEADDAVSVVAVIETAPSRSAMRALVSDLALYARAPRPRFGSAVESRRDYEATCMPYACVPSDLRSHSADRPRGRSKRAPPMPREWASIAQLDGELKERAMGFL